MATYGTARKDVKIDKSITNCIRTHTRTQVTYPRTSLCDTFVRFPITFRNTEIFHTYSFTNEVRTCLVSPKAEIQQKYRNYRFSSASIRPSPSPQSPSDLILHRATKMIPNIIQSLYLIVCNQITLI